MDHRLKSIYDALDVGNYKLGLTLCNKWLKKVPQSHLLMVLKAYALDRIGDEKESIEICDSILKEKILDQSVLSTLLLILKNQARRMIMFIILDDAIVTLYKNAYEAAPWSEELGQDWALATIRARDFKQAQLVSMALFKKFKKDQYMYWYIMSLILQVENNDPNSLMLLNLGEKMMDKNISQGKLTTFQELALYAQILVKQGKWQQLKDALMSSQIQDLIKVEKDLLSWILNVLMELKDYDEAYIKSIQLLDSHVDDWKFYEIFISCLFHKFSSASEILQNGQKVIKKAQSLVESPSKIVRSPFLAEIYLYMQLLTRMNYRQNETFMELILGYTDRFGTLPIYFKDVKPFLSYFDTDVAILMDQLKSRIESKMISITNIRKQINLEKIMYYFSAALSFEDQKNKIFHWIDLYNRSLPLEGSLLDEREMQYGDDLILLAVLTILQEYSKNRGNNFGMNFLDKKGLLLDCLLLLEYALEKSKFNFYFKIIMVRIYMTLNAFERAAEIYKTLDIKQIQHESLSYLITDDCYMAGFYSSVKDILLSAQSIYKNNMRETPEMIVQAFKFGTYGKISEFHQFFLQIDQSLYRRTIQSYNILNDLVYRCQNWDDVCSLMDTVDKDFLQCKVESLRTNQDFSVIPHFADDFTPNLLHDIHDNSDLEPVRVIEFTKWYCNVMIQWRSQDQTKLQEVLDTSLNDLFKGVFEASLEIIQIFTRTMMDLQGELPIKTDDLYAFLLNKKKAFLGENMSNAKGIYSCLLNLQTITAAMNVLTKACESKSAKPRLNEATKCIRDIQRTALEAITQRLAGINKSEMIRFGGLFDSVILEQQSLKEKIISDLKRNWLKSFSDIQSGLHMKINQ